MKEQGYFSVIGTDTQVFNFDTISETLHFNNERKERHEKIINIIGTGKQFASFVVDKRHPNGNEIHTIFDNGIIIVRNQRTNLLITELIARPQQLKRYWEDMCKAMPIELYAIIAKAQRHQNKNYNNW